MEGRVLFNDLDQEGRWIVLFCINKKLHFKVVFWSCRGLDKVMESDLSETHLLPCVCDFQPLTVPSFLEQWVGRV